jgi:uncharacterized RDD family membrane protein YckC
MVVAVQQVCSSCGNPLLPDGEFCLFCGDVLDRAAHPDAKVCHPSTVTDRTLETKATLEYAGFWLRVWAGAIDVAIEVLGTLILTVLVGLTLMQIGSPSGISPITIRYMTGVAFIPILAIGAWLYCAFSESSRWRATLGKRIVGLQVLTASRGQLSFGQATVRHFMKFLSLFTATVGFMMAGWTRRRQALHDMPSDCIVVKVAEPCLSLFGRHS